MISYITMITTVSFQNFKSQNFKLSVSNLENEYVAYVSVLSRISNCVLCRSSMHIYIYIYICICTYVCIYIYIYIYT